MKQVQVNSEIGSLKKVLLHRPGDEIENLTPEIMGRLLFDDIPFLKVAQEEHDAFAQTLRNENVEVVYITDLIEETLEKNEASLRQQFIKQFVQEAGVFEPEEKCEYFDQMSTKDMIKKMITGVRTREIKSKKRKLSNLVTNNYPFVFDPLPSLLFQRDPFASLGNGVSINKMYTLVRNREAMFADYIFKYHPDYKGEVDFYYKRDDAFHIEGGDELVLNKNILAIGISQRTQPPAIETLAQRLFFEYETSFSTILAFNIPKSRSCMHLDTVFTQVDFDKFTVYPGILGDLEVFEMTKENGEIKIDVTRDTLAKILSKYLKKEVRLIMCGDGDAIAATREQWNDGANTLCVRPGVVVTYSRNWVTNNKLRKEGVKVLEVPSSELSRGRGGPRCMAMPLQREDIN